MDKVIAIGIQIFFLAAIAGTVFSVLIATGYFVVVFVVVGLGSALCYALAIGQFFTISSIGTKVKESQLSKSPSKKPNDKNDPDILF